jgi:redox-sensitive bicupin YhaK (pirin superfamily)
VQLWVNLPKSEKMIAPPYQEIPAGKISSGRTSDGKASVRFRPANRSACEPLLKRARRLSIWISRSSPAAKSFNRSHYGPFVMNTPEEIHQAFNDYRSGRYGVD